jgi:predicted metal-dependent hydrolase
MAATVDLDALAADDDFRHGVDLFNHGFPWEAHEAWEPLWLAAPRERPERALLQGLIHAAAAAVKARAGATDAARGLVTSACAYLARATPAVFDVAGFIAALTAWAGDPARPPPAITLAPASPAAPP